MQPLLLGFLLLVVILLLGRGYVKGNPARMARITKRVGGAAALSAAFTLFLTGRVFQALPLAVLGLWLLGKRFPIRLPGGMDDVWTRAGRRSTVRAAMLEVTLDHDTELAEGRVLAGRFAGRPLSQLSRDEIFLLLQECMLHDPDSTQLLRAYMERAGIHQEQAGRGAKAMSAEEAYEVLGLQPGASLEEIHQAHRTLMKKNHPDQGGSTYLASKINEAKDVLLQHM